MDFGAAMFFTDYSMTAAELGQALEARGFESVWAPEHSHIPSTRKTPPASGGELEKRYYDVMDPFVTLAAAAMATKTLKVGTGVCLVIQRDTIQTAKLVASIDHVSGGRFLFGIGGGWNQDEIEDHGTVFKTRFKKMREQIEAMKEIWTKSEPEYHGELSISRKCGPGRNRCRSRIRRSSSAAPFRTVPAAQSATVTDGYRTRAAPIMPMSPSSCRSFGRWRQRAAAMWLRSRSRSGAFRKTSIASNATAIRASPASSSVSPRRHRPRSCRLLTAGLRLSAKPPTNLAALGMLGR